MVLIKESLIVDKEILMELKYHAWKHKSFKDAFRPKNWRGRPNLLEYIIVKNGLKFEEIINNSRSSTSNYYGGR